jgi:N-acylglucosamine-6-phosphate 2-epimerase
VEKKISFEVVRSLTGALIVSSQASSGEPLCAPEHIAAMALSAVNGGAKGLRLEGADNVAYLRSRTSLPIIGLTKSGRVRDKDRLSSVYITATFKEAQEIAEAGSDIVAIDATERPRPDGSVLSDLIKDIHAKLNKPVWADIATVEQGMAAAKYGADVISTTLYGYTAETVKPADEGPDFGLLKVLCAELTLPVVLEGRVWDPEQVKRAFDLGAFAVVVGSAITRPQLITRRFVRAIPVSP